jgi:hypothetical protein
MRRSLLAAAVLAVFTLPGCTDTQPQADDADAQRALDAAVDRTLDAETLHFETEGEAGGVGGTAEGDFVAPDRYRSVVEDGTETIMVGTDIYLSNPDTGRFTRFENSCDVTLEAALPVLSIVRDAEDVWIEDGTYRFSASNAGSSGSEGEARVEDGLIVFTAVTIADPGIPDGPAVQQWLFSGFGSPIEIAAPSDDLVDDPVDGSPLVSISPGPPQSCP